MSATRMTTSSIYRIALRPSNGQMTTYDALPNSLDHEPRCSRRWDVDEGPRSVSMIKRGGAVSQLTLACHVTLVEIGPIWAATDTGKAEIARGKRALGVELRRIRRT